MPKMWVEGLEEFGDALVNADEKVMDALKMAVYDGAHVLFMEVENQIREAFGFKGTPLRFIIRERKEDK